MAGQNPHVEDHGKAERIGWFIVASGALVMLAGFGLWRAHWPVSNYQQIALFLYPAGAAIGTAGGRAVGAARRSRRMMRKPMVSDEKTASDAEGPPTTEPAEARGKHPAAAINAVIWTMATIVAVWAWIVPRPYAALIWANVLTPLLGIPLVFWSKGKVKVVFLGKDEPPQIIPPFFFCGLVLCIRALDRPILASSTIFLCAAALSLPFAALAWRYSDERAKGFRKILNTTIALAVALVYSAGTIVTLDRVLDTTTPMLGRLKIVEKYISRGRSTSYMISVSPPEAADPRLAFNVGQSAYDKLAVDDVLLIGEHKGAFGVRWFDLRGRVRPSLQAAPPPSPPGRPASADPIAALFPAAARAKNVGGVTRMKCLATADGRLSDCAIIFECPAGHGFGEAALKTARYFKMRPRTVDGRPVGGGQVIIPMKWKIAGAIPAECSSPPTSAKP